MHKGNKCHSDSMNAQVQTTQSKQNVLTRPSVQLCDTNTIKASILYRSIAENLIMHKWGPTMEKYANLSQI